MKLAQKEEDDEEDDDDDEERRLQDSEVNVVPKNSDVHLSISKTESNTKITQHNAHENTEVDIKPKDTQPKVQLTTNTFFIKKGRRLSSRFLNRL